MCVYIYIYYLLAACAAKVDPWGCAKLRGNEQIKIMLS